MLGDGAVAESGPARVGRLGSISQHQGESLRAYDNPWACHSACDQLTLLDIYHLINLFASIRILMRFYITFSNSPLIAFCSIYTKIFYL